MCYIFYFYIEIFYIMSGKAIGIDLGTTYSCIGAWRENKQMAEVITNDLGFRTTASFVSFTDDERIIGDTAKSLSSRNVKNTIFDIKRLIGRKFSDPVVQEELKRLPYEVVKNDDDNIKVKVMWKNKEHLFSPEEISAMILQKMKECAETYLGEKVENAVITVPAYFNDNQRASTVLAGKLAGLNVLRIINEPTAASLAYGIDLDSKKQRTVLVFDFGGGTLDVTIFKIGNDTYTVQSTSGDTHLGGVDIDETLLEWVLEQFKKKHKIEITNKLKNKIKLECEKVKKQLSSTISADIQFEFNDVDFKQNITRTTFDILCNKYFEKTLLPITQALDDAKLKKSDIYKVVLVGGSSRIPKIQDMLKKYFGKDDILCNSINPDECVALGAALQAAKLMGSSSSLLNEMLLVDVTPLSLGVSAKGGVMANIIDRNTTVPVSREKIFTTSVDGQPSVQINIYEGERAKADENNKLGMFELIGLTPAKAGTPQIKVQFNLDVNGILFVTAEETSSGKKREYKVENKNKLSDDVIAKMLFDAESHKQEDILYRKRVAAKNDLQGYIANMISTLEQHNKKLNETEVESFHLALYKGTNWMESQTELMSLEEYEKQKKEMELVLKPLIGKIYKVV